MLNYTLVVKFQVLFRSSPRQTKSDKESSGRLASDSEVTPPLCVSKYKVYKVDSSLNTTKFFIRYWWNSAINYMFRPI